MKAAAAPSPRGGRRARIEEIVARLIELLDTMDDTDGDACEAEDAPPPVGTRAAGDEDDAEADRSPLSLGAALAQPRRVRRRAPA